jgi:hypothetical protein
MRTQESIAAVRRDGDLAEWVAFANEAATTAASKVAENDHIARKYTRAEALGAMAGMLAGGFIQAYVKRSQQLGG